MPENGDVFAFTIRNQQPSVPGALISYQVTVDSVQRVSGLVFFDVLPDAEETRLKQQVEGQWLSEAVKR